MKFFTAGRLILLILFGVLIYILNIFLVPRVGMLGAQVVSAFLILILLVIYIFLASKERDERERSVQLQSDSIALYTVIAGLLASAIFYPRSEAAMVFWYVLALAGVGRIASFMYHRYK